MWLVDISLIHTDPRSSLLLQLRSDLRSIYNAIYMLGMLFGSYIFGWASDNFGRVNALMMSVITVSLSGFFG